MVSVNLFAHQIVAVLGLARSGLAAAKALMAGNANVVAWDDDPSKRAQALAEGIPVRAFDTVDLSTVRALILSPGIPHTYPAPHSLVALALKAGVPLLSDIALLAETQNEAMYVGITGTNGKSTTTALIGHILQMEMPVAVGGNIGKAALSLEPLNKGGVYVLEMSSYQLDLTPSLHCKAAVLLNITPDHLKRHGGMWGYIAAKKKIFNNQQMGDVAIIGVDDEYCRAIYDEYRHKATAKVISISACQPVEGGIYVQNGKLIDDMLHRQQEILDTTSLRALEGTHNAQNMAAAYAVARAMGVPQTTIIKAFQSFRGLPHRQEKVGVVDRITYINDSKATNVVAAAAALANYDTIFWIAGGRAKDDDILALAPYFPHIKHAFLIGEAALAFAAALEGRIPFTIANTLDMAVQKAREVALKYNALKRVVLLSPACESLDQFNNFEHRGEVFRQLVLELPGYHEYDSTDHDVSLRRETSAC